MSKVFTIDDDPIQHRVARMVIEKNKLFDDFLGFTEAQKAFEFIKDNWDDSNALPDFILLDLEMPEVNGWDFLNMVEDISHSLEKPMKVIIVSSSIDEREKTRSKDYSFVKGFISKPISPLVLKDIIDENPG